METITLAKRSSSNQMSQLGGFFVESLKEIYWAENYLVKALKIMANEATTEQLRQALMEHKETTGWHIIRLEKVFNLLGKDPQGRKCYAIEGIIHEVEYALEETVDDYFTRDVALIMNRQKAEHYEIATYVNLVQLARTLGRSDIAELLWKSLDEEKEAEELLTGIAACYIYEESIC